MKRRAPGAATTLFLVAVAEGLGAAAGTAQQPIEGSFGEPVLELGVLEGDDRFVFAHVQDLTVTPSGVLLVLDDQQRRLSAYTPTGRFIRGAGRAGNGPGEFVHPAAVDVLGGEVLVLDDGRMLIHRFALPEDSLRYLGSFRLPFPLEDLCVLGEHLIGFGYHEGRLLHELSRSGEPLRSFGEPFVEDPVVAPMLAGLMACLDGPRPGVAVTSVNHPVVYVYDADGTLRWKATLEPYDALVVSRSPSGSGVVFRSRPDGREAEFTVSLFGADERLVVQWGKGWRGMSSPEDVTAVTTGVLALDDGRLLSTSSTTPRADWVFGARIYARANDPYPRVRAYELERTRGR